MKDAPTDAPPADVAEVSLIGPGYGESIVVHLGEGEWIIVDSCAERGSRNPVRSAAAVYLTGIGVDLATQVPCVLATHWHDDHIKGLSDVVGLCASAEFCCAVALSSEEFLGFASFFAGAEPPAASRSTREITDILEILEKRDALPKFLKTDSKVLERKERGVEVCALSPSDERIAEFLSRLAENMPKPGATRKKRIRDAGANELSVALLIDLGNDAVLLGADLEETPGRGWTSVIGNSQCARGKRASVYKVAHHGSKTADCPDVWEKLLLPTPFALLTPFSRGRRRLPSGEDVSRILERTPNAYSSARTDPGKGAVRRDKSVERTVRESGWKFQHLRQGHIRMRRRLGCPRSEWSIDLYGDAVSLKDIRRPGRKKIPAD